MNPETMTQREAEAVRARYEATGDEACVRAWNAFCKRQSKLMAARDLAKRDNRVAVYETYRRLWGG